MIIVRHPNVLLIFRPTIMAKLLFLLSALLLSFMSFSQNIQGKITNSDNQPIPFATIYIEELQTGTSANQQGIYEIHVKPGTYTLSFRSMGFSPKTETVKVENDNKILNISLDVQSYILAGVTVRADAEDPAYAIMRKAIARTPGFINQAKSYTSNVYIKGMVKATKIPKILQKKMTVNGETPKVGQTYVNESINRIRFEAPDNYVQEVISVNNSFPLGESDVPVIEMISGSIYESQDDFYISPFAPNSFSHYNFSYEGLLQDGAWFIDKIKVTPKRESKLLMSGYLYIVEDLWCLYSYDIVLKPPYVELKMKQHYAPVSGNNYFPVNLFAEAKISIMGIKAEGTYTTTIKYDSVILNPEFSQKNINPAIDYLKLVENQKKEEEKKPKPDPKVEEINAKLDELYKVDELNNREMVQMQKLMAKKASIIEESKKEDPLEITSTYKQIVNKNALVHDSLYWDSVRPVPASTDEKISYNKVTEKENKNDSTSAFVKVLKTAAFGNSEWERSKKFYAFYPGLLAKRNIGFNPVDGVQLKQGLKLRWKYDSISFAELNSTAGYSWERKQLFGKTRLWITYWPERRGGIVVKAGNLASNYNENEGINENLNALYNLFLKQTYIKFYQNTYFDFYNRLDVANGMEWHFRARWQQTDTLNNNTNFSIIYPDSLYAPNIPVNREITANTANNLNPSTTFTLSTGITYTPRYYYRIDGRQKHYLHSKWPTFGLFYHYAIPLNKDYSKYHFINFTVNQKINIYNVSSIEYRINSGIYLDAERIHFSNFTHFKTIEEPFTAHDFKNAYLLLNTYEYSTSKKFFEGHFRYSTQFLLLKRLPWISNKFWTENLYANLLYVDGHYPYYEAGYSMGQLFFAGEIGVFAGFKGNEFHGVGVRALFEF